MRICRKNSCKQKTLNTTGGDNTNHNSMNVYLRTTYEAEPFRESLYEPENAAQQAAEEEGADADGDQSEQ